MPSEDSNSNADLLSDRGENEAQLCRKRKNGYSTESNERKKQYVAANVDGNSQGATESESIGRIGDDQTDNESQSCSSGKHMAKKDNKNGNSSQQINAKRQQDSDAEAPEDETSGGGSSTDKSRRPSNRICLVCGDRASGFNFNILSCESCKAFFRRNALKSNLGKCLFTGDCKIEVHTRRFCSVCRLAKCFKMGMKQSMILDEEAKEKRRTKVLENRERRARIGSDKQPSNGNGHASKNDPAMNSSRSEPDAQNGSREETNEEVNPMQAQNMNTPVAFTATSASSTLHAVAQYSPFMSAISIPIHVPVSALTNIPISIMAGQSLGAVSLANHSVNPIPVPPNSGLVLPMQTDTQISQSLPADPHHLGLAAQPAGNPSLPQNSFMLPTAVSQSINTNSSLNIPYANQTMELIGNPAELLGSLGLGLAGSHSSEQFSLPGTGTGKANDESGVPVLPDAKLEDERGRTAGSSLDADAAPLLMTVASLDPRYTFVYVSQSTGNEQPDVVPSGAAADANASFDGGPVVQVPSSLNVSGSLTVPEARNAPVNAANYLCMQGPSADADELRKRMNRRVLTYEEWKFISYLCAFFEEAFISDQHSEEIPHPNTTLNALVNVTGFMVRKLIRFAKRIVDFQTLRQDSQIALLKGGVVNMLYLRSAFHYDAATESWCTPHGRIRADILKQALRGSSGGNTSNTPPSERAFCDSNTVYEEHCQFARSLTPLLDNDLNIVTLLQVIALFSPDRPSILQTYLPKSALLCPFSSPPASANGNQPAQNGNGAGKAAGLFAQASARLSAVVQPNLTLNVTAQNQSELTDAIFVTTGEQTRIANIQDKFVVLLKHYLEAKYSYSRSRTLFVRIMQKLDELNELTEVHGRVLLCADPSKIEPLMLEVLDLLASR